MCSLVIQCGCAAPVNLFVSGVNQMPGCVLRVSGSTSKVRSFLAETRLKPTTVFFKGEPRSANGRVLHRTSGFNVSVTGPRTGASIVQQCRSAAAFIRRHRKEFERLKAYGFSSPALDFGLYDEATEKHPWPIYRLSPGLVKLAGTYNLSIELSFYGKAKNKHR
jgi:hypothetical protein